MTIIGFNMNRRELYNGDDESRNEVIMPTPGLNIVDTDQVFANGSISGAKIGTVVDTGNAGITSEGNNDKDIRGWAGASFAHRAVAPFRYNKKGEVTATSMTLTGGTISYGKTSFTDTVNAGYYISSDGLYVGSVGDASKLKYDLQNGTFDFVGTVSNRSTLTIATAINADGNLVTDIINEKIDSSGKKILSDFDFGSVDYAGAVKSGDLEWDTSTGVVTSGSGVAIYRGGIVGADNGDITFSIDATTGDALFAGKITSTEGSIGGWQLDSGSLTASSGTVGLSSAVTPNNDIRFWAGSSTPADAPFIVYENGDVVAKSLEISGVKVFGAIVDASGEGDYLLISEAIEEGETSIYVRNGAYYEPEIFTLSKNGMTITGESTNEVIIYCEDEVRITGNNIKVSNLTLINTSLVHYGDFFYVLSPRNNIEFKNLVINAGKNNGLYINGTNISVDSVKVTSEKYSLRANGTEHNIINSYFEGKADNYFTYPVCNYINSSNTLITNCRFKGECSVGNSQAVVSLRMSSINFINNDVFGINKGYGVLISLHNTYINITNCNLYNGHTGVVCNPRNIISNNTIRDVNTGCAGLMTYSSISNNIIFASPAFGIFIEGGSPLITGNIINGELLAGIWTDSAVSRLNITNNKLDIDEVTSGNGGYGLYFPEGIRHSIISNNHIECESISIYFAKTCNNNNVIGNYLDTSIYGTSLSSNIQFNI